MTNDYYDDEEGTDPEQHGEWRAIRDDMIALLDPIATMNAFGKADYWINDDNWGLRDLHVEIQKLSLMSPAMIGAIQDLLQRYRTWEVTVIVYVPSHDDWPKMGLSVTHNHVVDHLRREFLPLKYRYVYGPPLKGVTVPKDL